MSDEKKTKYCSTYLLAGDIGGTNSRLGLYRISSSADSGTTTTTTTTTQQLVYKEYENEKYLLKDRDKNNDNGNVETAFELRIISPFLKYCWERQESTLAPIQETVIIACLAVAGPVRHNKVQASRLQELVISGDDIVKRNFSNAKVCPYLSTIKVCNVINDFVAQGYGCLNLTRDDAVELVSGSYDKIDLSGPKVCIGAGTGLGTCYLLPDEEDGRNSNDAKDTTRMNYKCYPSEYGQSDWSPRTDLERRLWEYLKDQINDSPHRLCVEEVVSGRGIANCYEFLATQEYPNGANSQVRAEIQKAGDFKGRVVAENVENCKVCKMTMNIVMG
jgi:glucokinase